MTSLEVDQPTISKLKFAVGPLEHLFLVPAEHTEAIYTLAWFVGESLDTAAFLTAAPDPSAEEHRVYWLTEKKIGCLVIGRHQGPQGAHDWPTKLSGYVRPISDVRRLELQDINIEWPQFGDHRVPELQPTVVIHFDDEKIAVSTSDRTNDFARKQASYFIDRLKTVLGA